MSTSPICASSCVGEANLLLSRRVFHLARASFDVVDSFARFSEQEEHKRYLEELEGIEMTFEGLQKLNFVEAALVIQVPSGSIKSLCRVLSVMEKIMECILVLVRALSYD